MLLSGALFALFMTGFWLYCLTDAIMTPAWEFPGLSKRAWVTIIVVTFIGGAVAWLLIRPPLRGAAAPPGPSPRRAPAPSARTRSAPKGPDDDPEFLRALDRAIRRGLA
jgi:hypothetical protein